MNALAVLAALTVFGVNPYSHRPILPDADPEDGVATDTLKLAAAKGEIEAVSFVVRPDADYAKVDVVPSDLTGPGGVKIPSAAADVALVKVWFRPGGRWTSAWAAGRSRPEPINNLVLHDDSVVKVDFAAKTNYLRGEYSDGVAYMNMSRTDLDTPFNDSLEPVRDAPKFVPFDLKKDFRQQYLITWKIPKDALPGDYKGTVTLTTPTLRAALVTLGVSLRVHPFALPRPRTHYDSSRQYVSFWMGAPTLERLVSQGHRLDRAERKLRAIYRSMVEHNAVNLCGIGRLSVDSTDDLALRTLLIARQEGLSADPLVNGLAFDMKDSFVWSPGKEPPTPEEQPERYRQSLERFRVDLSAQCRILDKYLGHHNCYFTSVDECAAGTNRRSYGYWSIIHELGCSVWTDYALPDDSGAFIDMNAVPASIDHAVNAHWHRSRARAVSYAAPFTGPENPDIWRRVKGIRDWYADLDGIHEYAMLDAVNRWNEFVARGRYCQFGMGFWTIDGMISTLSWEAVREAFDDVRYYTLLRLRAEAALRSDSPDVRRLGREAIVWQDGVDPERIVDLDAFRLETAAWIERLIARVGPQPEEKDGELPPPSVLPPDSSWQGVPRAAAGAAAVFKFADGCGARYDLALKALEDLFGDETAAVADRVSAAIRASALHSEMRERDEAVRILEDALALKGLSAADCGKLSLKRVVAMMTDEKYQERYEVSRLDKASAALKAALQVSGMTEAERFAAVRKMADGYLAAEAFSDCIGFAKARLDDTRMTPAHQAGLDIVIGKAWMGLREWRKALTAFAAAHGVNNNETDGRFLREVLVVEAEAAEKDKDYARALKCWTDLASVYAKDETVQRARAVAQIARLRPLAGKTERDRSAASDAFDEQDPISLDE